MKKLIILFSIISFYSYAQCDSTINLRINKLESSISRAKTHFIVSGITFAAASTINYLDATNNIKKESRKQFKQTELFFWGIGSVSLLTVVIEF